MEEYRKAKDLEEVQEYKPALMALLRSLEAPRRTNPKRESAIKDVAAILHKLGETEQAIKFLHIHRFEMTNIPQFLNFTANLMFQFEPRPDDAYPRILVVKPISTFVELARENELKRLMYEIFTFHRFKIEDVSVQTDRTSTLVTFETHSSARKAACQWQKDIRSFIAEVTWPNGDPIEVTTTKVEPTAAKAPAQAAVGTGTKEPETGTIGEHPGKKTGEAAAVAAVAVAEKESRAMKRVIGSAASDSCSDAKNRSSTTIPSTTVPSSGSRKQPKKWVKIIPSQGGASRAIGAPRTGAPRHREASYNSGPYNRGAASEAAARGKSYVAKIY